MLANISPEEKEFREVEIPVSMFGLATDNANLYKNVKEMTDRMMESYMEIEQMTEVRGRERRKFKKYPLFHYCEYQEGCGTVKARFSEYVKPYLLSLTKNFTRAKLGILIQFRHPVSHRIYWLLKQYKGFKEERVFPLEELKDILGMNDKYARLDDFRRRVLDVAKQELSQTDIPFTYSYQKQGRKVQAIVFHLNTQQEVEEPLPADLPASAEAKKTENSVSLSEEQNKALSNLLRLGLSTHQAQKIVAQVPPKAIHKTCHDMQVYRSDNRGVNIAAYTYRTFIKKFGLE